MPTLFDMCSPELKAEFDGRVKKGMEVNALFDAQRSVNRETEKSIVTPAYTRSALLQMGDRRAHGASKSYRLAFASAFADAWTERYTELTGKAVQP